MKTLIVSLLIVLVVTNTEALRCYCAGRLACPGGVVTCPNDQDLCATINYNVPSPSVSKGCYNKVFCKFLSDSPLSTGTCCDTDLCNA